MNRQYNDMYALFRHDGSAEAFFNALPSHVQDQISARYKMVDSLDRLRSYAESILRSGSLETGGAQGSILPAPWTF